MTDFATTPLTPEEQATANRLQRQESLKLKLPKGVAIIGCGGVGSWIAYFLALAGVRSLWLFDGDTVSDHNLNRLPLPPSAVGKPKSNALGDAIASLRPECRTIAMGQFTEEVVNQLDLSKEIEWVVCSTDTLKSRQEIHGWAHLHDFNYIEAAAEGEIGSIAATPADFATPEETQPGYLSVPVWVGPCVAAAQMACSYILHSDIPMYGNMAFRFGIDAEAESMVLTGTNESNESYMSRITREKLEISEREAA